MRRLRAKVKSREHVVTNGRAAFYACMWEDLRSAALNCGWALGLHGSLSADMDIMAMAWTDGAAPVETMIRALSDCFTENLFTKNIMPPTKKPNGRLVYTMSIWADFYLDINIIDRAPASPVTGPAPIPMVLHCPECRLRHIDVGEFATKPHHTHACQGCGFVWRPAVGPTVGIRFLPGFKNRMPTRIVRNEQGNRCATCDGIYAHAGEVRGKFDGSDWEGENGKA